MTKEIFVSPIRLIHIVYVVSWKTVVAYEIEEIYFNKKGGGFRIAIGRYSFDDLGKTVFRTRAEAEKKRDEVWKK